jgi:nucleotidyltransferase substrate binding protein (TIGR01987 family)
MTRKLQDSLSNLDKSLTNLESALLVPRDRELVLEGTIQRFEVTIELFWKTLKRALEYEGFAPKTPRESLRQAFQAGWLHDEELWLDMLDSRNTTSHNYLDEEMVEDNYDDIVRVTPTLRNVFDLLRLRYPTEDEGGL